MIQYKIKAVIDYGIIEGCSCGDMITFYAISKKPAPASYFLNVTMNKIPENMEAENIDIIIDIIHGSELIK